MTFNGETTKIDNLLQERSRLVFEFPTNESNGTLDRVCPFFENPKISEKKSSNLIKYDVLGRTSNFLGYTGAKSKRFSVEFFITLQHVVDMATNELTAQPPAPATKAEKMDMFFAINNYQNDGPKLETTYYKKRMAFLKKINNGLSENEAVDTVRAVNQFLEEETGIPDAYPPDALFTPDFSLSKHLIAYQKDGMVGDKLYPKALDIILFWVGLIRMSCLNSRRQPTLGPPILRFNHGVLFQNVATVLQDYSITAEEQAGFDAVTLLPNRIKISLTLLEIQRNKDPRDMTNVVHIDQVKGWDDILQEVTTSIDPLLWDHDLIYGDGI